MVVASAAGLDKIFPLHQVIPDDQQLKIICNSDRIAKWKFIPIFTDRLVPIKKQYIFGNIIFIPKAIDDEHSGTYICNGYSHSENEFVASSEAYVASKKI